MMVPVQEAFSQFKATGLEKILHEINEKGGFKASVLATTDGLPIAIVPPVYDSDTISAMVAMVLDAIQRAQSRLGFARVDEVSAVDDGKMRLVCRYFSLDDESFILAVVVPPNRRYRSLTNQAISRVRQIWRLSSLS